jgi:hypothetical protein
MLQGPKLKNVKNGGCIAAYRHDGIDYVSAFKGNNTCEYYQYNLDADIWYTLHPIGEIGSSGKKRRIVSGAVLTVGPRIGFDRMFYAAKGSRTCEWWEYHYWDGWHERTSIPAGARPIKDGAGAASVVLGDTGYVYLLKGSRTLEFYRYNVPANTWEAMASAPSGLSGKTFRTGSALTGGEQEPVLYVLKGGTNEFYAYDCTTGVWATRAGLPLIGSSGKKKKAGAGAGLAWAGGRVYCLKGGNTNELWCYSTASDSWIQLADMPFGSGRRVKGGGGIAHAQDLYGGAGGDLYALRGNNTRELWSYCTGWQSAPDLAALGRRAVIRESRLMPFSTPARGLPVVRFSLPKPGAVSLRLYDGTGRLAVTLAEGWYAAGAHAAPAGPRPSLPQGIYILRFRAPGVSDNRKLVVVQ